VSKAIDEFLGLAYCKDRGVPVVIVRYFNTIGPRQVGRYGMVVPRFVQQALNDEPITVYGDGEQIRSFTDVEDTVRATIGLSLHPAAVGHVFNVGSGQAVTINDLAGRVKTLTGSQSRITHIPFEEAYEAGFEEPQRRVPDITKLRTTLNFSPRVDLDTSLRRVIGFYRAQS
jgi:UDP-glucose 4-epimerase